MATTKAEDDNKLNQLSVFCENTIVNITNMKKELEGDNEAEILLSVYQEKCGDINKDLRAAKEDSLSHSSLCEYLQKIAQLVLDFTYVEECNLVENDFPESTAHASIKNIFAALSGVEQLAERISPSKTILDVLSPEIVECIRWRKGALLYMYCHVVNAQNADNIPSNFKQHLEDGVGYLVSMLSTRCSPKWIADLSSNGVMASRKQAQVSSEGDSQSDQLYTQGILSDTHLLALMYCGEMCYWHTKAKTDGRFKQDQEVNKSPGASNTDSQSKGSKSKNSSSCNDKSDPSKTSSSSAPSTASPQTSEPSSQALDITQVGKFSLQNFIDAAKSPMLAGQWNTSRAEELLNYLQKVNS